MLHWIRLGLYRLGRAISRRKISKASCDDAGWTSPASRMLSNGVPSGNTSLPIRVRLLVVCYPVNDQYYRRLHFEGPKNTLFSSSKAYWPYSLSVYISLFLHQVNTPSDYPPNPYLPLTFSIKIVTSWHSKNNISLHQCHRSHLQ